MKKFLKRFKGFTLIELLAVIVILAIIAIIAIPIVMNIINESRKNAAVASADGYIRAVNYKIAQEGIAGNIVPLGEYVIGENELDVDAKNKDRITGAYEIDEHGVFTAGLCIDKYSVEYSSGKAYYKKEANYCGGEYVFEEPNGTLLSSICEGTSGDTIYQNNTEFKIKTVEDLVCFSQLVNSGKNFSGKKVYLLSNLDINNPGSYKSSTTTKYADVNGNGNTEGLLTELTTGAGFKQIGTQSTPFSGEFLGYAFTISNLMINRPSESYVGLFGYSNGTIRGIKLNAVNITGKDYTAGLLGFSNKSSISSIFVEGNITGSNYVAGILGGAPSSSGNRPCDSVVFKGNVTGTDRVAGLMGYNAYTDLKGLVYDSVIKTTKSSSAYIAKITTGNNGGTNTAKVSNVTLTFGTRQSGGQIDGENYKSTESGMLVFDDVLDTYIGGDNDSDGYYFDYDSNGNIAIFSTERTPIQNKLKGNGTSDKPYIIKNVKDWKMASSLAGDSKYFSVTSDIDFEGKNYYPLGTNTNKFNGNINGNMHTISNITVGGYKYVGIIGYNTGVIEGFRFNNISISASSDYAGIVGYNDKGVVKGIESKNTTVEGKAYTAGLVGYINKGEIRNSLVEGNITGTDYVAGIIGGAPSTSGNRPCDSVVFKGNVTGTDKVAGLMGYNAYIDLKGLVYDSTIKANKSSNAYIAKVTTGNNGGTNTAKVSNVTLTYGTRQSGGQIDGENYKPTESGMLVFDDVLDTYIGGDNDSDGYYFDYDLNGNLKVLSTTETPIQNKLSGSGTESNPYLIKNADDWKMASSLAGTSKYFSVINDIDFEGKNYYPLGTNTNKFNGNINGNMHTISNITVGGYKNVGIIGYNTGVIEGFRFNNTTISASSDYAGIVGYNDKGVVKGIESKNTTVEGKAYTAGLVGYTNKGEIRNSLVEGNITGTNYVAGILGRAPSSSGNSPCDSVVFKGNVTGTDYVAGLMGYNSFVDLKGLVYDSTIKANKSSNAYINKVTTGNNGGTNNCRTLNVTLTFGTRQSYGVDGTTISELSNTTISPVLDTSNSSSVGYYFTLTGNDLKLAKAN